MGLKKEYTILIKFAWIPCMGLKKEGVSYPNQVRWKPCMGLKEYPILIKFVGNPAWTKEGVSYPNQVRWKPCMGLKEYPILIKFVGNPAWD